MSNRKITCIALDLDGTTINSSCQITHRTINILKKCQEIGIRIIPVTGRTASSLPKELNDFDFEYIVGCNGAIIQENHQIINETPINQKDALEYISFLETCKATISVGYDGKHLKSLYFQDEFNKVQKIVPHSNNSIKDIKKYIIDNALKVHKIVNHVLTIEERDRIVGLKNNFPNLRVAITDTYCIEAISNKTSKGIGLTWLLNHLNINSDQVMAIGDSESDIPMFEVVGISCAVDNAFEQVKEKASMIIKSNDDEGVAGILEKLIMMNMTNKQ